MDASASLRFEQWPIDRLIDYARNPRKNDHVVNQMAAAIVEFGFRIPVVARSTGDVVDGHLRLKAARKLGLATVPVVLADELSDAQIKAFRLLANRSATWAEWDNDLLALELAELSEAGYDLALTGFDDAEIEQLLATGIAVGDEAGDGQEEDTPDAADAIPEISRIIITRPGDIWRLGEHRLICGDAADPAVVESLMAGERADLCFTSPPYGNQRDYTSGGIADWDGLMRGVFSRLPMSEGGQVLVNLGLVHRDSEWHPYWNGWLDWMRAQGWRRFGWYVWDQGPGMPGDWAGRLAPSFEFLFHFNRQSKRPHKIVPCKFAGQETHLRADGASTALRGKDGAVGGWTAAGQPTQDHRIPDSVIRIMRHKGKIGKDIDHPAVFPVALPQFVLEAYTDKGEIVFEPFCGSGTTILAAQRTGRKVRAVEIAPEYVDVAIRRFQQNHPGVAVTLLATGQTFEALAAKRLIGTEEAR